MSRIPLPLGLRRALATTRWRAGLMRASASAPQFAQLTYSQYGEDIVAKGSQKLPRIGAYVDIGAAYPTKFSNTYYFYRRGWSGINIDPNPLMIKELNHIRPRDVNICAGIGIERRSMDYFMFNDPILNTFSRGMAEDQQKRPGVKLVKIERVEVYPLQDILQKHLPHDPIDLMNIDTEGLDFEVLVSNDWSKWHPGLVLVEEFADDVEAVIAGTACAFLREHEYRLIGRTGPTSVYASHETDHSG